MTDPTPEERAEITISLLSNLPVWRNKNNIEIITEAIHAAEEAATLRAREACAFIADVTATNASNAHLAYGDHLEVRGSREALGGARAARSIASAIRAIGDR